MDDVSMLANDADPAAARVVTAALAAAEADPEVLGPRHETVDRRLVRPDAVLSTLSWSGKTIAARLLAAASAYDRTQGRG